MEPSDVRRASDAAQETAAALGLKVSDAIVLHNSDRIAVRLLPCDVLVRIAPESWREGMQFEAVVAERLADIGGPVGALDSRVERDVYIRDGFAMTFWTYYEPVGHQQVQEHLGMTTSLGPVDYASALAHLHADLRQIDLAAPHVMDRVTGWQQEVEDPEMTPELRDRDRDLLAGTLRSMSAAIRSEDSVEQLLHGEPHPGNVLDTREGPLWIDVGTLQRGPANTTSRTRRKKSPSTIQQPTNGSFTRSASSCGLGSRQCAGLNTTRTLAATIGGPSRSTSFELHSNDARVTTAR